MDRITKNLITQLKQVRLEKKLTPQEIVDMCHENGDYISVSTVKRILGPDSENQGFRYDTSIKPIARALLGLNEDPDTLMSQQEEASPSELDALRSLVDLKNHLIEQLESGIKDREQTIQRTRAVADERLQEKDRIVAHLKKEVEALESDKAAMQAQLAQRERDCRLRTIALTVLVSLLIASMGLLIFCFATV